LWHPRPQQYTSCRHAGQVQADQEEQLWFHKRSQSPQGGRIAITPGAQPLSNRACVKIHHAFTSKKLFAVLSTGRLSRQWRLPPFGPTQFATVQVAGRVADGFPSSSKTAGSRKVPTAGSVLPQTVALFPDLSHLDLLFSMRSVALFQENHLLCFQPAALAGNGAPLCLDHRSLLRFLRPVCWPRGWWLPQSIQNRGVTQSTHGWLCFAANGRFVSRFVSSRPFVFNEIGSFVP